MAVIRKLLVVLFALLAVGVVPLAGAEPASASDWAGNTFLPVTPCRLLDTRSDGGPIQPGAGRLIDVVGAGDCNIPDDAFALEATVTAVSPTGNGFLRAYRTGLAPPSATYLNYARGEDISNTGAISITPGTESGPAMVVRTYGSATNVVIDIQGFYRRPQTSTDGNLFVPSRPCRTYDSRQEADHHAFLPGESRGIPLTGKDICNVPDDAVAIEATITAVESPGTGFIRAWPSNRGMPNATFLTHTGGRSTTNTGAVAIRPGTGYPNLMVKNFGTSTHIVVEVQGWFIPSPAPPASTYRPRSVACRVFDTRKTGGPIAAGGMRQVQAVNVPGCNVPDDAVAYEVSITAIDPTGSGFTRVVPVGTTPQATFLNFAKDRSTTNTGSVKVTPGANPNLELWNYGSPADYVVEVQGWFIETD